MKRVYLLGLVLFVQSIDWAPQSWGADRFWLDPAAGLFSAGSNWDGGMAAGIGDTAYFGLNAGTAPFVVSFTADQQTSELKIINQNPSFDLNGFTYDAGSYFEIGRGGNDASLVLEEGIVSAGLLVIGLDDGDGKLTMSDGMTLIVGELGVGGANPPSSGKMVVIGPETSVECNGGNIGFDSNQNTGELEIHSGGSFSSSGGMFIGREGGVGSLLLDGGSSLTLSDGDFYIGAIGAGSVVVEGNQTTVDIPFILFVGENGGSGALVLDSAAISAGHLFCGTGGGGVGSVDVSGATSSFTIGGDLKLALDSGSTGSLVVDSDGSVSCQVLRVGELGDGILEVKGGSTVSSNNTAVGVGPNSSGMVSVVGPGSNLSNPGFLHVGVQGYGGLTILAGGQVATRGLGVGVDAPLSSGSVTVSGPGSVLESTSPGNDDVNIASFGSATLFVSDGALFSVTNGSSFVGRGGNTTGQATVTGAGSSWTNTGNFFVGIDCGIDGGTGSVVVSDGALVSSAGFAELGCCGCDGHVTISGAGSMWNVAGSIGIGFGGGTGTLTVESGGAATATQFFVESGGAIRGNGTIHGDVLVNGGYVEPGLSPGVLSVDGDYSHDGGAVLFMEIGGLTPGTQHDQLAVTGTVTLDGILYVRLINGLVPIPGQSFEIVQAADVISQFSVACGGFNFDVTYNPTSVVLTALSGTITDCNSNGIADQCDISVGTSLDANTNNIPDECDFPFGDINHTGTVDLDDILCMLTSFAGNYACAGGLSNADIVPCGGNGQVNLDDILAILQAFAGADLCP